MQTSEKKSLKYWLVKMHRGPCLIHLCIPRTYHSDWNMLGITHLYIWLNRRITLLHRPGATLSVKL